MGKGKEAVKSSHCPWALTATDGNITRWLNAYGMLVRFPSVPQPGLNDPRVHEALTVIALEFDAIRDERSK